LIIQSILIMTVEEYENDRQRVIKLLDDLYPLKRPEIAEFCHKKNPALFPNAKSLETTLSHIKNDQNFRPFRTSFRKSGDQNFPFNALATILEEKYKQEKVSDSYYCATMLFIYWSEGRIQNKDLDILKVGFIALNSDDLTNRVKRFSKSEKVSSNCILHYVRNGVVRDRISGVYRRDENDDQILIFNFDNGTSILMCFDRPGEFADSFYKGVYVASPGSDLACGTALFKIYEKHINDFLQYTIEDASIIAAELYKKRFLIKDKPWFSKTSELKMYNSYVQLENIKGPYLRYRFSSTTGKIHGDLITIESFGRVIYRGSEATNIYGRCFVQTSEKYINAKNLIIELYQQPDTDKRGFEFRSPHSFMMFDIRDVSLSTKIIKGYMLRPKTEYFPHTDVCYLIKVRKGKINEQSSIKEFAFNSDNPVAICQKIKGYHDSPRDENEMLAVFEDLLNSRSI